MIWGINIAMATLAIVEVAVVGEQKLTVRVNSGQRRMHAQ